MLFTGNDSGKSSPGTANASFYASLHSAAQVEQASSEGSRDGPQRSAATLGPTEMKSNRTELFLLASAPQTQHNQISLTYIFIWQENGKIKTRLKAGIHFSVAARTAYTRLRKKKKTAKPAHQ